MIQETGQNLTLTKDLANNLNEKEAAVGGSLSCWLYTLEHLAKEKRNFEIESQIKKPRPSVVVSINTWNSFEENVLVVLFTSENEFTRVPFEVKLEVSAQNGLDTDSKIFVLSM